MILMRLSEMRSCQEHTRAVVVLEDMSGQRKLAADALALARRSTVPVYVSANAFSDLPPYVPSPSPVDQHLEVTQWLERINPSDFSDVPPDHPTVE